MKSDLLSTLLLVLFIGLKLGDVITWSWVWVFSPIWIPMLISLIIVALAFTFSSYGGNND
jgi:hypothetical protein